MLLGVNRACWPSGFRVDDSFDDGNPRDARADTVDRLWLLDFGNGRLYPVDVHDGECACERNLREAVVEPQARRGTCQRASSTRRPAWMNSTSWSRGSASTRPRSRGAFPCRSQRGWGAVAIDAAGEIAELRC